MALKISGASALKTMPGLSTRPTSSKVRAAIFNIWQWQIKDSQWLDICCGSGAMSAEALIRGAKQVTAIEVSRVACKLIHQNLEKICKPDQSFVIHCGDAIQILPKLNSGGFDLIYFDPPYQSSLHETVLALVGLVMSSAAILAVEHSRERNLIEVGANLEAINLEIFDQRTYGQTAVSFFRKFVA